MVTGPRDPATTPDPVLAFRNALWDLGMSVSLSHVLEALTDSKTVIAAARREPPARIHPDAALADILDPDGTYPDAPARREPPAGSDAAWEALRKRFETPGCGDYARFVISEHRPAIEAAARRDPEPGGLDEATVRSFDGKPSAAPPLPSSIPFSVPPTPSASADAERAWRLLANEMLPYGYDPETLRQHRVNIEAAIRGREGLDVDVLARAMHDAMCDVSHHDRGTPTCHNWPKYPAIAASVARRYARLAAEPRS